MVGAGACKSFEQAKWLFVAPVVLGSFTPLGRDGNEGELFYPKTEEEFLKAGFGLNSYGMPNKGFEVEKQLPSENAYNPLIISIAGFNVEDYLQGVSVFKNLQRIISAFELNFGCPNTEHGKIMSFDIESLDDLFCELARIANSLPVWVKFSPYSDPGLLKEVATLVNEHKGVINVVVTCNTFANAYSGPGNIYPNNGLAGLSGPALKPIAWGQVVQFRQHLDVEVDVIGVGGLITGDDIVDFLGSGAKAVQLTSMPYWSGNPGEFWERLLRPEDGGRLVKMLEG